MENKKNLLLDIDEVVCFPGFLAAINEFLGSNYVIDDFTDYYIDVAAIPKDRFREFTEFISQRNLYDNAQIIPYAVEVLRELNEYYNIYPCTACINPFDKENSGKLFANKYDFLTTTLPFINPENFILTSAKHLFKADIQIDDRLSNLGENIETKILFPSYHNKTIQADELEQKNVLRAGYDWRTGWLEVANILLETSQIKNDEIRGYVKSLR